MNGENEILEWSGDCVAFATGRLSDGKVASARVWLVDDHSGFRGLLAGILEGEGGISCERQFANPADLLETLKDVAPPDIILLDIQMGDYNGLDAIRPIKAMAAETHVMMLTTFSQPGSREQAFRAGASDFILKSSPPSYIAKRIRQAMEFGTAAGLLTTFLSGGTSMVANSVIPVAKPPAEPTPAKTLQMGPRTTIAERWMANLRGLLKFSPSRG